MLAIFPELAELAKKEDLEYLAIRIRQYFGGEIATKPMINMDVVFQGLGIPTNTIELGFPSAIAAKDQDGKFNVCVVFDVTIHGAQRRFLQAHMLGHFLLEYQTKILNADLQKSGYKETVLPLNRYTSGLGTEYSEPGEHFNEHLCDRFAAALLLPKGMLVKVYSALGDSDKVAEIFGVTPSCVEQRLLDIKLAKKSGVDREEEIRLRGINLKQETKISSDDVSMLNLPKKVSVIKENKAREFAKSIAEENKLAMKSMDKDERVDAKNEKQFSTSEFQGGMKKPPLNGNTAPSSGEALKKLRLLAKKIDSSVSID